MPCSATPARPRSRPCRRDEEGVEGAVEGDQRTRRRASEGGGRAGDQRDRRRRTTAAALTRWRQPQVERRDSRRSRTCSATQGTPAAGEVGPEHRAERPALQVGPLDGGIEHDAGAGGVEAVARGRCPRSTGAGSGLVEAADGEEAVAAHRAEPGPERLGRPALVWWTWWWSRLRNAETARAVGRSS